MCLPWNHKWETTSKVVAHLYDNVWDFGLPIGKKVIITQRCDLKLGGCGKEIVRKYRV